MIAIDTNVLVRLLVRDDEPQFAAARRLVASAATTEQAVLIMLCALWETEWVLRSRYKLDKASISSAFIRLLESGDVAFEDEPTVEEAIHLWNQHPGTDFADCLLNARAAHLGRDRFVTFDFSASRLPRTELLAV